jgi:hypothetical protein
LKGSLPSGAHVQVIAGNQAGWQTYFGQPEGHGFVLKNLTVSGYEVWVWAPGFVENTVTNVSTVSPKNSITISLQPAHAGSITAHVVNNLGQPVGGVKVSYEVSKTANPKVKAGFWCATDVTGTCAGDPTPPVAAVPLTLYIPGPSPQQVTWSKNGPPVTVEFKQENVINNHQIIRPADLK